MFRGTPSQRLAILSDNLNALLYPTQTRLRRTWADLDSTVLFHLHLCVELKGKRPCFILLLSPLATKDGHEILPSYLTRVLSCSHRRRLRSSGGVPRCCELCQHGTSLDVLSWPSMGRGSACSDWWLDYGLLFSSRRREKLAASHALVERSRKSASLQSSQCEHLVKTRVLMTESW